MIRYARGPEIAASTSVTGSPHDQWNDLLLEHGGHLLQSWSWGDLKHRHGWLPERALVQNASGVAMAQVLFRSRGPISMGYIPRGPLIAGDAEALWPELLTVLDDMARRHRAISIFMEPNEPLPLNGSFFDHGVVRGPDHIQPERTVMVPLLDDEELLGQMHQKTRYNVRLAGRRGVQFRALTPIRENIALFYQLMQDTAQRNEFGIHSLDYYADFMELFGESAVLMGAWSKEGNLAAMLISALFGDEAIYMYGASSTQHRAHGAAFALQFEVMKWARARGAKRYDLWGIPAQDPESQSDKHANRIAGTRGEDWRGLYRFKVGFGGNVISYPTTLERRYVPILPALARRFGRIGG